MDKLVTYRQLIKTTLQAYERLLNPSMRPLTDFAVA